MRKLKYHEKKLLKKVDFISWEVDQNVYEAKLMRRFMVQKRVDFVKYKKLANNIRALANEIKSLDAPDPFRAEATAQLLDKLYHMGLIETKNSLGLCAKVNAESFCRRRLPVLVAKNQMTQSIKMATQLVEQGHIRVGPKIVMDPACLITRSMEDFITWVDTSAISKHIQEYNDVRDDFEI